MYKQLLKQNILLNKFIKSISLGTMYNFDNNKYNLNEGTLQDLINTMNNNYRSIATYKEPIRINNLKEYYYAGTKLLKFYCNSKSNSNNYYSTNIMFGDVDFVQQDPQSNDYREFNIVDKTGQSMQILPTTSIRWLHCPTTVYRSIVREHFRYIRAKMQPI